MEMANCPKCNYKLKLTDWRPNCPSCGVNLVYYGMEERLLADADKAETEHAHFQKRLDRVKASYAGSKLTIARIVLTVLPLGLLFLPLAQIILKAPYIDKTTNLSILTIGMKVANLDFGALMTLAGSKIVGTPFLMMAISMVCILLTAVLALLGLILLFLSCSPRGFSRNLFFPIAGIVLSSASALLFQKYSAEFARLFPGAFTGSIKFGIFAVLAAFLLVIIINIIIKKVGVPIKYKETFINGVPAWEYMEAKEKGEDIRALIDKYNKRPEEAAEETAEDTTKQISEATEEDAEETAEEVNEKTTAELAQEVKPQEESKGE